MAVPNALCFGGFGGKTRTLPAADPAALPQLAVRATGKNGQAHTHEYVVLADVLAEASQVKTYDGPIGGHCRLLCHAAQLNGAGGVSEILLPTARWRAVVALAQRQLGDEQGGDEPAHNQKNIE